MLRTSTQFSGQVALTLLPWKLSTGENIAVYNRQRVLQQFGYDKKTVRVQGDTSFLNVLAAENRSLLKEGRRYSPRGVLFWAKCTEVLDGSISNNDGPTMELPAPVLVKDMDPFLRVKKKVGPIFSLELGKRSGFHNSWSIISQGGGSYTHDEGNNSLYIELHIRLQYM